MSKPTLKEAIGELKEQLDDASYSDRDPALKDLFEWVVISRDSGKIIIKALEDALKSAGKGTA